MRALGDLVVAGTDARVLELGQSLPVTLARDDGAQDLLPRLAGHVRDDFGQLDVHLRQVILHVLSQLMN